MIKKTPYVSMGFCFIYLTGTDCKSALSGVYESVLLGYVVMFITHNTLVSGFKT
jgi:hypothetical protein